MLGILILYPDFIKSQSFICKNGKKAYISYIEPKYQKLYHTLKTRIEIGEYAPGSKLPGQNLLAEEFGVSPITTKRVLCDLADSGYIIRRPKSGSYVCDKPRRFREITIHIGEKIRNPSVWMDDYWHGVETSAAALNIPIQISRKLPPPAADHGIILVGAEESVVEQLKRDEVPHVAAITRAPFADYRVAINYPAATDALIQAMRANGCRNLCFLGNLTQPVHRMAGAAFRRSGGEEILSVNDRNIVKRTEELLARENPPDGLIVMGGFLPFYIFPLLTATPLPIKLGVYTEHQAVLHLRDYAFIAHYELKSLGRLSFDLLYNIAGNTKLPPALHCPAFEILTPRT